MTHFVHHFARIVNEWGRFVLVLLKRVNEMAGKLNEMAGKLNEMNRFVGRLGRFVELLIRKVGEMTKWVSWFFRKVEGMHYFVDEMDYFVQSSLRFAELFSDQMDPYCAISGPLDDLRALPLQRVWPSARLPWDCLKMGAWLRFRRAVFGTGPLSAGRMPGHRLRRPKLRVHFLQP